MPPIKIALFTAAKDNTPKAEEHTWDSLVALLSSHAIRDSKDGPAWSPTEYKLGFSRSNSGVDRVTAAVFDLDHVTASDLERMEASLTDAGYAYVVHSTHTHESKDYKFRLVLRLSRPLSIAEWVVARRLLINRLDIPADPATKDPARIYYLPSAPPGATPIVEVVAGKAVDVEALLTPRKPDPTPLPGLNGVDIHSLYALLRKVRKPESKEVIRRVLAKEPLAPAGERDATMNRLAGIVAYVLPLDTPFSAIAEIVRPSLAAMESDADVETELAKFEEKYDRATRRREEEEAALSALKGDIQALNSKGRAPYTSEQLAKWAAEQNTTVEGFRNRWLIQKGTSYFVFINGKYERPLVEKELSASLPRDLARAPVELTTVDHRGMPKKRTPAEVMDAYGSVARTLRSSVAIAKSYYDAEKETFYEATCPLRDITPTFHRQVQTWLELLGGAYADKLLDWVASVTKLEAQCAAIFLQGANGAGKDLFAHGLARLWTEGPPTEFASLIADFNEPLARCPLVFANEGFPRRRDYSINDELRRLIGSSERSLYRKYIAASTLEGAIRLVLAANNDRILDGISEMSEQDRLALSTRLLYIPVGKPPREFLESLPISERVAMMHTYLAEHALWLRDNRKVTPGPRFIVEGAPSQFHDRLSVMHGLAPAVCEFLVSHIDELTPQKEKTLAKVLRIGNGEVWASNKLFTDEATWRTHVPGEDHPTSNALSKTLNNIRARQTRVRSGNKWLYFNAIKGELLTTWASITGSFDPEDLAAKINTPNPEMKEEP